MKPFLLLLIAFLKLRKKSISFLLSLHTQNTARFPLDGFSRILKFVCFPKTFRNNSSFIKMKIWVLYMKHMYIYDNTPLNCSQKHLFQTIFVIKSENTFYIKYIPRLPLPPPPEIVPFSFNDVGQYGRASQATNDDIVRRMRFACWITKATNAHSECVILIIFSRQQCLHEGASIFIGTLLFFAIIRSFDIVYSSFVTLTLTIPSNRKTKKK
jgi:hypothetical protein